MSAVISPRATERREQPRWTLAAPLAVYATGSDELLGHAVNVSLRGMLVVCERRVEVGATFDVDLEIPGDNGLWERTPFVAHSVRGFEDPDDETIYNVGFKIDYVSPQSLFRLQRLIQELEAFA